MGGKPNQDRKHADNTHGRRYGCNLTEDSQSRSTEEWCTA